MFRLVAVKKKIASGQQGSLLFLFSVRGAIGEDDFAAELERMMDALPPENEQNPGTHPIPWKICA